MICLGIEGTAHTFGVGIVNDNGKILSDVKGMYIPEKGWGIKPAEAAQHHEDVKEKILESALKIAKVEWKDIDIIAFSQSPGLPPCLHKTLRFAKKLSKKHKTSLVGVNHCVAHIEIAKLLTKTKDPVVLYVSGANTQVITYIDGRYRCMGECMDIGIGNALDKFGRELGLEFPAGPKIEALARKGRYLELPYVVKGMDLSFSGILTAALNKRKTEKLEDLCFSIQETMFAMLTEVTERALAHTGKSEVLLTGGVAANKRLNQMLWIMCRERGASFKACPLKYCGDCGANIAWTGILAHKSGQALDSKKADIEPRLRTDDVEVEWV